MPLPMLAWQVTGNPHAFDSQHMVGRLLQSAVSELAGESVTELDGIAVRRALVSFGVVPDRLCSTTITYGLRARGDTPLGAILEAAAPTRLPVNVSGTALDRGLPVFTDRRWLCVENPSLVELASLRQLDIPIVCTSGWPSFDAQRLLEAARQQGVQLDYAGDYDPEGIVIAGWMAVRYGATVAMTAGAYGSADVERSPAWEGAVPPTAWDLALAERIEETRRVVFQEDPAIADTLLADR
jgi:uncharacterized protein (TIGR02679 family)